MKQNANNIDKGMRKQFLHSAIIKKYRCSGIELKTGKVERGEDKEDEKTQGIGTFGLDLDHYKFIKDNQ